MYRSRLATILMVCAGVCVIELFVPLERALFAAFTYAFGDPWVIGGQMRDIEDGFSHDRATGLRRSASPCMGTHRAFAGDDLHNATMRALSLGFGRARTAHPFDIPDDDELRERHQPLAQPIDMSELLHRDIVTLTSDTVYLPAGHGERLFVLANRLGVRAGRSDECYGNWDCVGEASLSSPELYFQEPLNARRIDESTVAFFFEERSPFDDAVTLSYPVIVYSLALERPVLARRWYVE